MGGFGYERLGMVMMSAKIGDNGSLFLSGIRQNLSGMPWVAHALTSSG